MSETDKATATPAAATTTLSLENVTEATIDRIVEKMNPGPTQEDKDEAKRYVRAFLEGLRRKGTIPMAPSTTSRTMINARIDEIDRVLSLQLNEILHNPQFKQLEATWRGLKYLVDQTETSNLLKIKILHAPKRELLRDLQNAPKYDQSVLWERVYSETFDTPGGQPFAALVGDYEFGRHPDDTDLLDRISHIAAAAHAPFLSAASPDLFKLDNFTRLRERPELGTFFDKPEFAKWNSFRQNNEDSRYVALTLPHVLMRLPYGRETKPVDAFDYEEGVEGTEHSKYLWGNAAYALGARLTNAFANYGWCTAIQGYESGGRVEGLPLHLFPTDAGDTAIKCPTEIALSGRREAELANLGFVALSHYVDKDFAAFFSVQSCQKPRRYNRPSATASAELSADLPYLLAACRFAHYLKVMMRNKVGAPMSRKNAEDFLNEWIRQYVVANEDAADDEKRRKPLSDARVDVMDRPDKPGVYEAVAYLLPHYMLKKIHVALRLVSEIPNVT